MSPDTESDRIAVPTNGHKAPAVADAPAPLPPLRGEPPTVGVTPTSPTPRTDQDFSVAFTPKQAAVGFAIIASPVVLLVGRARRGRSGS